MLASAVKLAASWFALVFAAGIVLGTARVLVIEPRIGARAAELLEMPLMLVVMVLAARVVTRRWGGDLSLGALLAAGVAALGLLVAFEVFVVLRLRDVSLAEDVAARDPVSGAAYGGSLVLFALMPWLVERRRRARQEG